MDAEVEREIVLPLYYAGLTEAALIGEQDGSSRRFKLDSEGRARLTVKVPGNGRTWLIVTAP